MNWNSFELDLLQKRYPDMKVKFILHGYLPIVRPNISLLSDENHHSDLKICVGHSGYDISNHMQLFELVKKHMCSSIEYSVYCPLSYGDNDYIDRVVRMGYRLFDKKFHPLLDFMNYEQYNRWLNSQDIFIYGQPIPMGEGNLSMALSMGKKVFLSDLNPMYKYLIDEGFILFTIQDIEQDPGLLHKPFNANESSKNISTQHHRSSKRIVQYRQTLNEIIT